MIKLFLTSEVKLCKTQIFTTHLPTDSRELVTEDPPVDKLDSLNPTSGIPNNLSLPRKSDGDRFGNITSPLR